MDLEKMENKKIQRENRLTEAQEAISFSQGIRSPESHIAKDLF